ncbi:hypothetical protein [Bacillus benzoevorans]|uniref:Uncharacterized membrane protein (UPF0136 family) n=1 Tax=Bacillus benzoevorans TaxID=1456 RepID=A0A7X0LU28_9BACI|nr:hypothetical protein [Bacillus benzoevorans]MBB6444025.1 uncharacterized membrane protein (UPF0136 family) [Bacillus benzoevorans]
MQQNTGEETKLESRTKKYYSNRVKTGILAIICFGSIYLIYSKLLSNPTGLAPTGIVFVWALMVISLVMGVISLVKTLDPRPIVEIMPEGMLIRTFLFFEDIVMWDEVAGVKQEKYTNQVVNVHGYARVTTYFLRIYRPNQRPLAINLSLLNTRGNDLQNTIQLHMHE